MKRIVFITILLFSLVGFEMPQRTVIPDGAYGVFQCPAIEINVPLYMAQGNEQDVVDAEDSALIRKWGNGLAICDHADSVHGDAVWNVNEMRVGGSAFLITEDGVKCYMCTAIYMAENTGYSYVYRGQIIAPNKNDLICLSCASEVGKEYLAYYEYDGEIP